MEIPKSKLSFKYIALRTFFAVLAAFLISSLKLDFIESYFFDLRTVIKTFFEPKQIDTPIAIVLIDDKTIEKLQGDPKFKDHIRFINQVSSHNPKYIIYEFRINDNNEFIDITGTLEEKKEFADAVKNIPNLAVSTQDLQMRGVMQKPTLAPPLDGLTLFSMPFTADNKSFGNDGVSRRIMFQYQDKSMMQPIIASYYNPEIQNVERIRGQFFYLDSLQTYINFHAKGSFPSYKFEDVIDQKVPKNAFENKIVILGSDAEKSIKDYASTPFSRESTAMTKVELQANQIQTLIDNNSPVRVPKPIDIVITILISMFTVYVTLSLTPARGLLILGATLFGVAFIATFFFIVFGLWLDLAHPFLAIFLCYYFFIPYRLIRENRKSWEYYQKHKLLSEVEQLKTNFISMMSHDLKTPIARITGMTEVIYKDPVQLSPHQREALDTIRHSSDDLLKFINAILQYGSIESQGVQLHKQSKDINQLVADVVKKHQFLANVKKIKIVQELEPMFPTSVDPELMKQVFSNLLENAIKYSPDESMVHIRTREENDSLIIEFQDQGMGIPQEDLPNIFMKFFRTHNAKTTTIKGSGLGLYLAQYFVELHKGKITVDSSQDKGSKFTVELPLDK
ncbi:MAG: CHASE2 domain-containing protein [Pseudobdellovibrio sp.]|nr:CHASE2 domain-containing protein [Pseudobdellovibrio sp.]